MKNVLIVYGHSNEQNSLSNKTIIDYVKDLPHITIRNLNEVSKDFKFDIKAEQEALTNADVIVFQFPFHWYSLPAIFKKWLDDVLAFGFAYGPGGDKLAGKKVVLSFTTGAPADSYSVSGSNNYSVTQLLAPIIQSVNFVNMIVSDTVFSNGMLYIPDMVGDKNAIQAKAKAHGEKLAKVLEKL
ncbi:NAD(P)H dehydrogenase (quinone) [Denitrovibrio acetiphilus DSM 12809]|uniref:NAD(P)H dehydrogenase (Quinone) n=1 Tax=Denitrovibrio acetiphilus (strain DSM 12809 / NBRC 114555 / N2460) TaxID=522772 RepID=D4H2L6_DENA2|nr:NAD(P)H-dependent oxidoreductase [Denitrovibrio acetiphilus]ADD67077.1 NAD(P)H dehydrogenase (quinone) [Denitrovibrio acetiphilus DSM 12809]